jgi:hypothetical protein
MAGMVNDGATSPEPLPDSYKLPRSANDVGAIRFEVAFT